MRVSQKNGIIVVIGKLIKSDFKIDREGYMRAIYYVQTNNPNWTDPTGQEGSEIVNWTISAWDFAARLADPEYFYPEEYIAIEAIPASASSEIWRTKKNTPRRAIKLHALFSQFIDSGKEYLVNTVQYHRQGTMYPPEWRPDIFRDDDPDITGKFDDTGYDYGLGYQDDMRSDMEFFYEDERWSRD